MSVWIEHVTCSRHEQVILHDVSFQVRTGEVMGLLGPNGAGKTTLMRLVAGLARSDSGCIRVAERMLRSEVLDFGVLSAWFHRKIRWKVN